MVDDLEILGGLEKLVDDKCLNYLDLGLIHQDPEVLEVEEKPDVGEVLEQLGL